MSIRLYAEIAATRSLGPGLRYAIWVQGCPFRCVDCMTPGSLSFEGGYQSSIDDLAERILATPSIEGLTLSGGEPFAQAGTLAKLLRKIRKQRNFGVIVYSGYRFTQLQKKAETEDGVAQLLEDADLLIDGRYVNSLNDGGALRGSANQQMVHLSEHYSADDLPMKRNVEVHVMREGSMIVGVPSASQLRMWKNFSGEAKKADSLSACAAQAVE